jgi:hypothetical protein
MIKVGGIYINKDEGSNYIRIDEIDNDDTVHFHYMKRKKKTYYIIHRDYFQYRYTYIDPKDYDDSLRLLLDEEEIRDIIE